MAYSVLFRNLFCDQKGNDMAVPPGQILLVDRHGNRCYNGGIWKQNIVEYCLRAREKGIR